MLLVGINEMSPKGNGVNLLSKLNLVVTVATPPILNN
jgi:hypothetical protein